MREGRHAVRRLRIEGGRGGLLADGALGPVDTEPGYGNAGRGGARNRDQDKPVFMIALEVGRSGAG